jgi:hypothetical protein
LVNGPGTARVQRAARPGSDLPRVLPDRSGMEQVFFNAGENAMTRDQATGM